MYILLLLLCVQQVVWAAERITNKPNDMVTIQFQETKEEKQYPVYFVKHFATINAVLNSRGHDRSEPIVVDKSVTKSAFEFLSGMLNPFVQGSVSPTSRVDTLRSQFVQRFISRRDSNLKASDLLHAVFSLNASQNIKDGAVAWYADNVVDTVPIMDHRASSAGENILFDGLSTDESLLIAGTLMQTLLEKAPWPEEELLKMQVYDFKDTVAPVVMSKSSAERGFGCMVRSTYMKKSGFFSSQMMMQERVLYADIASGVRVFERGIIRSDLIGTEPYLHLPVACAVSEDSKHIVALDMDTQKIEYFYIPTAFHIQMLFENRAPISIKKKARGPMHVLFNDAQKVFNIIEYVLGGDSGSISHIEIHKINPIQSAHVEKIMDIKEERLSRIVPIDWQCIDGNIVGRLENNGTILFCKMSTKQVFVCAKDKNNEWIYTERGTDGTEQIHKANFVAPVMHIVESDQIKERTAIAPSCFIPNYEKLLSKLLSNCFEQAVKYSSANALNHELVRSVLPLDFLDITQKYITYDAHHMRFNFINVDNNTLGVYHVFPPALFKAIWLLNGELKVGRKDILPSVFFLYQYYKNRSEWSSRCRYIWEYVLPEIKEIYNLSHVTIITPLTTTTTSTTTTTTTVGTTAKTDASTSANASQITQQPTTPTSRFAWLSTTLRTMRQNVGTFLTLSGQYIRQVFAQHPRVYSALGTAGAFGLGAWLWSRYAGKQHGAAEVQQ